MDGENVLDPRADVTAIRKKIGLISQKPSPLPMSIYDNIAYGPRIHGTRTRKALDRTVRESLQTVGLWDELKSDYTIVLVTHILRQARRLADYVVFLYLGELVEHGPASEVLESPKEPRTQAYVKGEIS